jgi:hypothetical protein
MLFEKYSYVIYIVVLQDPHGTVLGPAQQSEHPLPVPQSLQYIHPAHSSQENAIDEQSLHPSPNSVKSLLLKISSGDVMFNGVIFIILTPPFYFATLTYISRL